VPKRAPLPALYWGTDKVGGPESRSVTTGKPISSLFTSLKAYPSCLNPFGLPCLARQAVFSSNPHVRSGGPTDRSAGLLVGWTHLSGTAESLVDGDLGVPMSHTDAYIQIIQRRAKRIASAADEPTLQNQLNRSSNACV
jgi:hypothetical protein